MPLVVVAALLAWPAATPIRAQQATPGKPPAPARKAPAPLAASGIIRGSVIELADGEQRTLTLPLMIPKQ